MVSHTWCYFSLTKPLKMYSPILSISVEFVVSDQMLKQLHNPEGMPTLKLITTGKDYF